jgi:hypothetical protein
LPVIEIRFIGFPTHSLVVILSHLHTESKSKPFVKNEAQKYNISCFTDVRRDFAA